MADGQHGECDLGPITNYRHIELAGIKTDILLEIIKKFSGEQV